MDKELNVHYDWMEFESYVLNENDVYTKKCFHCYCELHSFFGGKGIKCNVCMNCFCKKCAGKEIEIGNNDKKKYKVCECCYENYISFNITMNKYAIMMNDGNVVLKMNEMYKALLHDNNIEYENEVESLIMKEIKEKYEQTLKEMINEILNKKMNENDVVEWKDILYDNIKKVIYEIKTPCLYIHNGMDINDYIKITIMHNENANKCELMNGYIMKLSTFNEIYSNSYTKGVDIEIIDPHILIINTSALDDNYRNQYMNNNDDNIITPNEKNENEEYYINILVNKIKLIDVNVILIGNEINTKIGEHFINKLLHLKTHPLYIITNVKSNTLDKIAMCTQTIILPSTDFICKKTILGKCGIFQLKNISDTIYMSFNKCEHFFIGNICLYINTSKKSKQFFKKIKNILQYNILPLSRDLYLQSEYYYYINALPLSISFNTSTLFECTIISNTTFIPFNSTNSISNNITSSSLTSLETHKLFPHICNLSHELVFTFYSSNDESLSSLFINISKTVHMKCKICSYKQYLHHYNYYSKDNGCLTFKMILDLNEHDLYIVLNYLFKQTQINFWNETHSLLINEHNNDIDTLNINHNIQSLNINDNIFTYGYCKICKRIVTPLFTSTFHVLSYSKYRYIYNFLYNHSTQNNSTRSSFNISPFLFETSALPSQPCIHYIHKDINQIFITKHFSFVFEYSSFPKHIPFPLISPPSTLDISLSKQKTILHICINLSKILSSYIINKITIVQKKITSLPFTTNSLQYSIQIYEQLQFKLNEALTMIITLLYKYRTNIINHILSMKFDCVAHIIRYIQKCILMLMQMKLSVTYVDVIIHELICFIYNSDDCNDDFNGDNNESYIPLLKYLHYYNEDQYSLFSNHVDVNDIVSIITKAFTSGEYIQYIKNHKRSFNLLDINTCKQHSLNQMRLTFNANEFQYGTFTNEKICILLENELLSEENDIFTYEIDNTFQQNISLLTTDHNDISNDIFSSFKQELIALNNIIESIQNDFYSFKISFISLNNYKQHTNISKYKQYTNMLYEQANIFKNDIYNNNNSYKVEIYFPRQFETFRIVYCSTFKETLNSLYSSIEWTDVSGGKSKAEFLLSNDNKYIFKLVQENEFEMFLQSAHSYFEYISKYLFHKLQSGLAKILGVFKVSQIDKKTYYVVLMENLLYGIDDIEYKVYDLKGSNINRYVTNKERGKVFLDMNFIEDYKGEPISIDKVLYDELMESLKNDSLVLNKMNVVDYSLMLIIGEDNDNRNRYIKIGIIDYLRKYTWDKKLEEYSKKLTNGFVCPTIINPDSYRKRFINEMQKHFIGI